MVRESVAYGPTLVVWLIDRSASGQAWSSDLRRAFCASEALAAVNGLATQDTGGGNSLLHAVCTFGRDVTFALDPPHADHKRFVESLSSIRVDPSNRELTFSAVGSCLQKYSAYRARQRREVMFVMLTDEAGDDQHSVEQIADQLRDADIPLYVVGVPAPWGRRTGGDPEIEVTGDGGSQPLLQGPESVLSERILLGFSSQSSQLELIDSGFGAYGLEYLCRCSGGRFLALRPAIASLGARSWPATAACNFAPGTMRRYAPDYVSLGKYQALLDERPARLALVRAAKLTGLEVVAFPQLEFRKRSEAELSRQLSLAQQSAARLEPAVNQLYDTLLEGEPGRAQLVRPRWQAGYDLALGRAAAAKARISGYNAMLASLKRGRPFERATSDTWVLEPADSVEASSVLRRLIAKSAALLQRVVDQHPGTPWATVAEYELQTPAGWKWSER